MNSLFDLVVQTLDKNDIYYPKEMPLTLLKKYKIYDLDFKKTKNYYKLSIIYNNKIIYSEYCDYKFKYILFGENIYYISKKIFNFINELNDLKNLNKLNEKSLSNSQIDYYKNKLRRCYYLNHKFTNNKKEKIKYKPSTDDIRLMFGI